MAACLTMIDRLGLSADCEVVTGLVFYGAATLADSLRYHQRRTLAYRNSKFPVDRIHIGGWILLVERFDDFRLYLD